MISDLSNENSASPARTATESYGHVTRPVKDAAREEGSAGQKNVIIKSTCVCCGRPISLRIGRPISHVAPAVKTRLNDYAERLVTGRLPTLGDIFGFSERTAGTSRNSLSRRNW